MIIGVAGRNGAGKGELVRFLEARSFHALSLSDAIRDELIACQIDAKAGQAISGLKRNFFDSLGFIQVAADTPRESAMRGDRMAQRISGILGVEPCR